MKGDDLIRTKGNLIRALRFQREMRQEDVAEKANLSVSQLSRIECGRVEPSRETIEKLAPVLGVSAAYLDANILSEVVAQRATNPEVRSLLERVLGMHEQIAAMSSNERERLFQLLDEIENRGEM